MTDLQELLREAASVDDAALDLPDVLRRARVRRRRMIMTAGSAGMALLLALGLQVMGDSGQQVRSTPDGRPRTGLVDDGEGVGPANRPSDGKRARPNESGETRSLPAGTAPTVLKGSPPAEVVAVDGEIAFTRDGNVYVADADGSRERRVAARAHSPAWSPDGRQLAVVVPDDLGRDELAVVDADGRNLRVIRYAGDPTCGVDSPAWSPDGSRIAFVQRHRQDGAVAQPTAPDASCRPEPASQTTTWLDWSELLSVKPDGSDERVIFSTNLDYTESPSWSPDGSRIVFARSSSGGARPQWALYVVNADGSSPVNITSGDGDIRANAFDPAWSPTGEWIAFTTSFAGDVPACGGSSSRISLISPDGRLHPKVTDGMAGCDSEPAWAPDGSWLAFTRRHETSRGSGEIWIKTSVNIDGAERRIGRGADAALRPGSRE
jgi:Tol biopolymer transport system component